MMILGLPQDDVLRLLSGVRPAAEGSAQGASGSPDSGEAAEAFARVAWTVLAEPADEVASGLIEALGAAGALEAVLGRLGPSGAPGAREVAGVDPRRLQLGLARWRTRASSREVVRALEQAARFGCRLLLPGDPEWPRGLEDLGPRAPFALWARGRAGLLGASAHASSHAPSQARPEAVAIVGARAATGYGEHVAAEFAAGLAERGVVVVSGGAYGIDGAAHRGALATEGETVAVLAGGLDRFYPAGHESLLRRIVDGGAVLAEVPCGTPPTRFRFLQRNRLIAAMSASVVVVEAGARSGSLNTAGHAAEIGRPIGAVPGPVTSAASAGCHRLLREFPSVCVTSVDEVLALHRPGAEEPGRFDRPSLEALRVLDALRPRKARGTEELARLSGLAASEVRAVLGRLELEGQVARGAEGWVRR